MISCTSRTSTPYSSRERKKVARCSVASAALRSSRTGEAKNEMLWARAAACDGSGVAGLGLGGRDRGGHRRRVRHGEDVGGQARRRAARSAPRLAAGSGSSGKTSGSSRATQRSRARLAPGSEPAARRRALALRPLAGVGHPPHRPPSTTTGAGQPTARKPWLCAAAAADRLVHLREPAGHRLEKGLGRQVVQHPRDARGGLVEARHRACAEEIGRAAGDGEPVRARTPRPPRRRAGAGGSRPRSAGSAARNAFLLEARAQLGLADQHDRDQVAVVELEVGEEADLLEGGAARDEVRLVHDQERRAGRPRRGREGARGSGRAARWTGTAAPRPPAPRPPRTGTAAGAGAGSGSSRSRGSPPPGRPARA